LENVFEVVIVVGQVKSLIIYALFSCKDKSFNLKR